MYLIAALAVLGFFLGHVESYAYDNNILKCPNETAGVSFYVPQLSGYFTRVTSFGQVKGNHLFSQSCTTGVETMSNVFKGLQTFNEDISHWDTSSVKYMQEMFANAEAFNQDISNWDTSSVTNMQEMFANAQAFDSDISNWDTSNVENMYQMFVDTSTFNSSISNWDTSKVTNMEEMFFGATAFYQDLSGWCVSIQQLPDSFYTDSPLASNINFHPKWNGTGCTTTTTTTTTTTATTPDPTTTDDDTEPPVLAMILGSVGIGIVLSLSGYFVYKKRQPKTSIAFGPP